MHAAVRMKLLPTLQRSIPTRPSSFAQSGVPVSATGRGLGPASSHWAQRDTTRMEPFEWQCALWHRVGRRVRGSAANVHARRVLLEVSGMAKKRVDTKDLRTKERKQRLNQKRKVQQISKSYSQDDLDELDSWTTRETSKHATIRRRERTKVRRTRPNSVQEADRRRTELSRGGAADPRHVPERRQRKQAARRERERVKGSRETPLMVDILMEDFLGSFMSTSDPRQSGTAEAMAALWVANHSRKWRKEEWQLEPVPTPEIEEGVVWFANCAVLMLSVGPAGLKGNRRSRILRRPGAAGPDSLGSMCVTWHPKSRRGSWQSDTLKRFALSQAPAPAASRRADCPGDGDGDPAAGDGCAERTERDEGDGGGDAGKHGERDDRLDEDTADDVNGAGVPGGNLSAWAQYLRVAARGERMAPFEDVLLLLRSEKSEPFLFCGRVHNPSIEINPLASSEAQPVFVWELQDFPELVENNAATRSFYRMLKDSELGF